MNRLDRLLAMLKSRHDRRHSCTVWFEDGTCRDMAFLEAFRLCCQDEKVIDADAKDETGTSLLRAILDADDFSDLPELQGYEEQ